MKIFAILSSILIPGFLILSAGCHNPTFDLSLTPKSPTGASTITPAPTPNQTSTPTPTPAKGPSGPARNLMGINLNFGPTDDYSEDRVFADAMKSARMWAKGTNLNSAVPANLDANFWPTEDACLTVMAGLDLNDGTYHCRFTGSANVTPASYGLAGSIQNVKETDSPSAPPFTTFDVVITQSGGTFSLAFSNTVNPASATGHGITNLQIMRPLTEGSTQSYPFGTQFTDQIKALVSKFKVIRFMDFFRTNGNQLAHWNQRPLPSDASFGGSYRNLPDNNGDGHTQPCGGCYEDAVDLCNQTGRDLWLNVPLWADADFVTQLATLVQGRLSPNLNVYVEYSNEVWNTGGGFSQGKENHVLAQTEEAAGQLPTLKSSPADTNDWTWAWRRVGRKTVEVSNAFRKVWGDAALPSPTNPSPRVRPVLMAQQGYEAGPGENQLAFIDRNYPQPLNYYLYGCGGSGYYNPNDDAGISIDTFWSSGSMSPSAWYNSPCILESTLAHAWGLKRICYEGGPSLDKGSKNDAVRASAWADPRMQQNLVDHVDQAWSATDSDLFVFYASAGDYQWGFVQNLFNLATPKLQAIDQLNGQVKAAPVLGNVPPFTVNGADALVSLVWNNGWGYKNGTAIVAGAQNNLMYPFRTVTRGTYTLTLNAATGTDVSQVFCDGLLVGTLPAKTTATQIISLANLNPGVHVIMVKSFTAPLTVSSLTFAGP